MTLSSGKTIKPCIYGEFETISLPGDRLSWDLSQLYTTGEITAVPEQIGRASCRERVYHPV